MFFRSRFLGFMVSAAGASLLVQVLAFFRQVSIAACFGVSRDLDMYVVIYAIATFGVFTFNSIFDSIGVTHLVRTRERKGDEAARALAARIFRVSLWLAGVTSIAFMIAVPLLVPILATGFSPEERTGIVKLAWYFLPWTLICLPYYAAGALRKAQWQFARVFSAEIVVIVVSIGFLTAWHEDIRSLPLAYAAGYLAGLVHLLVGAWPWRGPQPAPPVRGLLRNIGELYLANQTGSVASIVDRHVQSFVPIGGVAAINYSAQLVNGLATVLTFREIFVVPLAQQDGRAEKLERLLCGLVLASVPLAAIVAGFAPDMVKVLFQRGRFDATATALTAQVLQINAFSLVTAAVLMPLMRMSQIVDRIHLNHLLFLSLALSLAVFGYLFVIVLELGVVGVALMQLAGSVLSCVVAAHLLGRSGIWPRWRRVLGYLLFAAVASGVAYLVATGVVLQLENSWGRVIAGGAAYGLVVLVFYIPARSHLRGIIFGTTPSEGRTL
jgi:putative peptidoglycan lipid II flippase